MFLETIKSDAGNMPKIDVEINAKLESAIRRFKRLNEKTGSLNKLRANKNGFEKPTTKRKRLKAAAVKRTAKLVKKAEEQRNASRSKFLKERGTRAG
jgi:small subunit ribosomal protein S21